MKRFYLIGLLVALMVLAPLAALAQDDDEWETYTSDDERFTIDYPAGWFAFEPDDVPLPAVAFINTEDGVARFEADEDPQAGDMSIVVLLLPADFMGLMGIELAEDTPITEVTETLIQAFVAADDMTTDETEVGEIEEIDLTDDITAGFVIVNNDTSDGAFIITELVDGVYLMLKVAAFPGEYTEDLEELGRSAAASASYDGTAEDVMVPLMEALAEEAAGGSDAPELNGELLVAERCTTCHTADRIYAADKTAGEWAATVDRMIGYGADLNAAEREAVIAHLTSQ